MRRAHLLAILLLSACASAQQPSVEELLDRWAQALGGREKLRAIQNIHSRSAIETSGLKGTVETWSSATGQQRELVNLGDGAYKETRVFDGSKAWMLDQNGKVRELQGAELKDEITTAYFASFSQFMPDRMKGLIEYAGQAPDGTQMLRITPDGGKPVTIYLDPRTWLPVKEERPEQERTQTITYLEWRDANGIKLPARIRQSTGDPKYDLVAVLQEAHFNQKLDAALFQQPKEAGPDFRFANRRSISLNFEMASNHIYVPVSINGKGPLWFIYDTGADTSVIDYDRARALGLPIAGALEARGSGEKSQDAGLIKNAIFTMPGLELRPRTIAAVRIRALEQHDGRHIEGILGYDFISRFVTEIDYANRRLTLYNPNKYQYVGPGESIPFTFQGNQPHIRAFVKLPGREPLACNLLVDSGSRLALSFTRPFIEKNKLLEAAGKTIAAPFGVGIGGESKSLVGRVQELQVGRFKIQKPITAFSQDVKGSDANPDIDGSIGGEILHRFRAIFDYTHQVMILEPNPAFNQPYEYDMLGASLVALPPDFKQFQVHRLIEHSAAAAAGLSVGDLLTSVDGRPAAQFTLQQLRDMFKQDGKQYRLGIRRGQQDLTVTVTLHRLI